jgi:large subunit ribosomal protein L6
MGDLIYIRRLKQTPRDDANKSHIFSRLDLPRLIKFPSLPNSSLDEISIVNNKFYQNQGISQPANKAAFVYIFFIPSGLSCDMLEINEGSYFIFNSRRGGIRILIPSQFRCLIHKQTVTLSTLDPHLGGEFKTWVGAFYRAMLSVTIGYKEKLKTAGRGYKGTVEKTRLMKMVLGYSHPIYYFLSPIIKIKFSRKNNKFNLKGPNSAIIKQSAADLYSFKRPDIYRGKGVRYRGYKLRKKEGKKQQR